MSISKIVKSIKSWISILLLSNGTAEEQSIRRYNILISICVTFMVVYGTVVTINLNNVIKSKQPTIEFINYTPKQIGGIMSNNLSIVNIVSSNKLDDTEFYEKEVVGLKYWPSTFGYVTEKILGVNGYSYRIKYKDNNHQYHDDLIWSAWELYRPQQNLITPFSLQD